MELKLFHCWEQISVTTHTNFTYTHTHIHTPLTTRIRGQFRDREPEERLQGHTGDPLGLGESDSGQRLLGGIQTHPAGDSVKEEGQAELLTSSCKTCYVSLGT